MPNFENNCANCIFLGEFRDSFSDIFDLYYCPTGGAPDTVVARWGPNAEYSSGMDYGKRMKDREFSAIGEAYRRAVAHGLIVEDDSLRAELNHVNHTPNCIDWSKEEDLFPPMPDFGNDTLYSPSPRRRTRKTRGGTMAKQIAGVCRDQEIARTITPDTHDKVRTLSDNYLTDRFRANLDRYGQTTYAGLHYVFADYSGIIWSVWTGPRTLHPDYVKKVIYGQR